MSDSCTIPATIKHPWLHYIKRRPSDNCLRNSRGYAGIVIHTRYDSIVGDSFQANLLISDCSSFKFTYYMGQNIMHLYTITI